MPAGPTRWKEFVVLVKIHPDEDILPVRMDYKGSGETFNVGINYLTAETGLWYALPDVIASALLTGKPPTVLEAIRFVPQGVQQGMRRFRILGIEIDPARDNLIQILVEGRQKIKLGLKAMDRSDPEYQQLASRAQAMKILVNAMSYGIFIELNPEDKKRPLQVYGVDSFPCAARFETPGDFFYPILGGDHHRGVAPLPRYG